MSSDTMSDSDVLLGCLVANMQPRAAAELYLKLKDQPETKPVADALLMWSRGVYTVNQYSDFLSAFGPQFPDADKLAVMKAVLHLYADGPRIDSVAVAREANVADRQAVSSYLELLVREKVLYRVGYTRDGQIEYHVRHLE